MKIIKNEDIENSYYLYYDSLRLTVSFGYYKDILIYISPTPLSVDNYAHTLLYSKELNNLSFSLRKRKIYFELQKYQINLLELERIIKKLFIMNKGLFS